MHTQDVAWTQLFVFNSLQRFHEAIELQVLRLLNCM